MQTLLDSPAKYQGFFLEKHAEKVFQKYFQGTTFQKCTNKNNELKL